MAIKHRRLIGSKDGEDATDRSSGTSLAYLLTGSDVIDDMRAYIDAQGLAPATLDGLVYRSLSREQLGRRAWRWEVKYVEPQIADQQDKLVTSTPGDGDSVFSFDTTGATAIIFASDPAAVSPYPANATDHKGAINVGDHDVKGTEIVVPALKLSFKKRLPMTHLAIDYAKTLASLTGTTCTTTFKTFSPGELLFLGATGQQATKADPEVTFHFAASQNVTGLTIGEIAGVAKRGHDYLWVSFDPVEDNAAKRLSRRPLAAYVHKVYREDPWTNLGL